MKKCFLSVISICMVIVLSACSLSAGQSNTAQKEENIQIIQSDKTPFTGITQRAAEFGADIAHRTANRINHLNN